MRRKTLLVLKGIIFHITLICALLYVAGIDDIFDKGYFFPATIVVAALIYLCYCIINETELKKICFEDYFNRLFGTDEEDEW